VPKMGRTSARCACESLFAMSTQDVHNSRTELRKSVGRAMGGNALDKGKDCDKLEIDCRESGGINRPERGRHGLSVGRGTRIGKC
jgi:hypothetical protein